MTKNIFIVLFVAGVVSCSATGLQEHSVSQSLTKASVVSKPKHLRKVQKPAVAVLQVDHSISSQKKLASASKSEHSYFSHLLSNLRQEAVQKQKRTHKRKVNLCNGNQYAWMMEIRGACKDNFGDDSVWDQDLADGACSTAWEECNSDFTGTCCTQPEGPRNMEAYCARPEASGDRACAVAGDMSGVQATMQGIRDSVGLLVVPAPVASSVFGVESGDCRIMDGGRCVVSPGWPEDYDDDSRCEITLPERGVVHEKWKFVSQNFNTEDCCDKLEIGDKVYSGENHEDGPDQEVEDGVTTMTWRADFSANGPGWKVCAEDVPPPPPPPPTPPPALCLQDAPPGFLSGPVAPSPGPGGAPSPGGFAPAPAVQVWVPCPAPPPPNCTSPGGAPSPCPAAAPGPAAAADDGARHRRRRRARTEAEKANCFRHTTAQNCPTDACAWTGAKCNELPHGPRKPTKLEMQCAKLTDLVRKAGRHIDSIRTWSAHDGITSEPADNQHASRPTRTSLLAIVAQVAGASTNAGTSEAKDPDLTFAMQKVLAVGSRLDSLRDMPFCGKGGGPELDDDDDSDEADDSDSEDDDEDDDEPKVNGTAVASLLAYDDEMTKAADGFEKGVHPHGKKWWRYRYEYTLVESLVVAWGVMLLYFIMYLLHGVSFFDKFKFYNIGITDRLYRYAWAYFVFHAAVICIMVVLAYMLYMPWGKSNIFDYGATRFHAWVNGRANVPILGYSWLLMILDVQFQLFCCFTLYTIFIALVTHSFARALQDWKEISRRNSPRVEGSVTTGPPRKPVLPSNEHHYSDFLQIMTHRVQHNESFRKAFGDVQLRYRAVEGIDSNRQQGFHDFKLHIYLTNSLGKALEYLVEVSAKTNGFLAVAALVVAFLAHHYQVAFMYFLPPFIVIGILIFCCSYLVTRTLRNHDHKQPLDHMTVHAYCRSIQIVLYCVFFSFARLLLSSDIFTDYPKVYLSAFLGLGCSLLLSWLFAGPIMIATICAIVLPHESQQERFTMNLRHVAYWHTTTNCQECGVRQIPQKAAHNREWAGTQEDEEGSSGRVTSGRAFSFR